MVSLRCIICGVVFYSARRSKLCCSKACEVLRKSIYDHDRYLEFRNSNRKKRRAMLIEKYSIVSQNINKLQAVCDECLTKFYWDYTIYCSYENTCVNYYNATEYGVPYCPNCGLVERSITDDVWWYDNHYHPRSAHDDEIEEYLKELRRCKIPTVKRQAIYTGNHLDFISEAEEVRKQVNKINGKPYLTQVELNICIGALFKSIRKL